MRRDEVRWYTFVPPDKRRPVVTLTRDAVLDYLEEVTVASVTSTIRDIPDV
jgi:mRNA interferase MazF